MCFRIYGSPYGLYGSLCTLHLAVASFSATRDMGGWLDLSQQGLSPCKKYQALLGALTSREFPKSGYYIHIILDFGNTLLSDGLCPAEPWKAERPLRSLSFTISIYFSFSFELLVKYYVHSHHFGIQTFHL